MRGAKSKLRVRCFSERSWIFVVCSGVPGLDDETSTERDGQLFIVLSALADGESFDVVTFGGDGGSESWRKLHKR